MKEVRPMRHVTVKWGKLKVELPVELLLFALFNAFLIHHNVNV